MREAINEDEGGYQRGTRGSKGSNAVVGAHSELVLGAVMGARPGVRRSARGAVVGAASELSENAHPKQVDRLRPVGR